jgi:hypothetical protein
MTVKASRQKLKDIIQHIKELNGISQHQLLQCQADQFLHKIIIQSQQQKLTIQSYKKEIS